jgi:hypothetical protein
MTTPRALSPEQLAAIQEILEQELPENEPKCIPRSSLYEMMEDQIDGMERYLFQVSVTAAIKNGDIKGFETRHGRSGGICRAGVFDERDRQRQRQCVVTIKGKAYQVNASEAQVFAFLVAALDGKPTTDGADIYIGNAAYKLPPSLDGARVLENYLINKHNARTLDEDEADSCAAEAR